MNKNLIKSILIILVLVGGLIGSLIGAKQAAIYFSKAGEPKGKPIDGVKVTNLTQDSATLVWETQDPVLSVVLYGTNPVNLFQTQAEVIKTANHQVLLTNLISATVYYFKIQVSDELFDQNGTPYSFTTLASFPQAPAITEQEIKDALGTKNPKYDLNRDGIVNLLDLFLFKRQTK